MRTMDDVNDGSGGDGMVLLVALMTARAMMTVTNALWG